MSESGWGKFFSSWHDYWFSSWETIVLLIGFAVLYVMIKRMLKAWLLDRKNNPKY